MHARRFIAGLVIISLMAPYVAIAGSAPTAGSSTGTDYPPEPAYADSNVEYASSWDVTVTPSISSFQAQEVSNTADLVAQWISQNTGQNPVSLADFMASNASVEDFLAKKESLAASLEASPPTLTSEDSKLAWQEGERRAVQLTSSAVIAAILAGSKSGVQTISEIRTQLYDSVSGLTSGNLAPEEVKLKGPAVNALLIQVDTEYQHAKERTKQAKIAWDSITSGDANAAGDAYREALSAQKAIHDTWVEVGTHLSSLSNRNEPLPAPITDVLGSDTNSSVGLPGQADFQAQSEEYNANRKKGEPGMLTIAASFSAQSAPAALSDTTGVSTLKNAVTGVVDTVVEWVADRVPDSLADSDQKGKAVKWVKENSLPITIFGLIKDIALAVATGFSILTGVSLVVGVAMLASHLAPAVDQQISSVLAATTEVTVVANMLIPTDEVEQTELFTLFSGSSIDTGSYGSGGVPSVANLAYVPLAQDVFSDSPRSQTLQCSNICSGQGITTKPDNSYFVGPLTCSSAPYGSCNNVVYYTTWLCSPGFIQSTDGLSCEPIVKEPPTVSLAATPGSVPLGGNSTLSWTVSGASSCSAGGGWSGLKDVAGGSQQVTNITSLMVYTLTCGNSAGDTTATTTVDVSNPDFVLSGEGRLSLYGSTGQNATSTAVTVRVSPLNGFAGPITLSASVAPDYTGFRYVFSDSLLDQTEYGGGTPFQVYIPSALQTGTVVTVTGVSGSLTRTLNLPVSLSPVQPRYEEF